MHRFASLAVTSSHRIVLASSSLALLVGGLMASPSMTAVAQNSFPSVTSISPSYGPTTGGTLLIESSEGTVTANSNGTVTIKGANLSGATAVTFGNVASKSFSVLSSTDITAVPPPQTSANIVTVSVTAGGLTSSTSYCALITVACGYAFSYLQANQLNFKVSNLTLPDTTFSVSAGTPLGKKGTVGASCSASVTLATDFSGAATMTVSGTVYTSTLNEAVTGLLASNVSYSINSLNLTINAQVSAGGSCDIPVPDLALPDNLGGIYVHLAATASFPKVQVINTTFEHLSGTVAGGYLCPYAPSICLLSTAGATAVNPLLGFAAMLGDSYGPYLTMDCNNAPVTISNISGCILNNPAPKSSAQFSITAGPTFKLGPQTDDFSFDIAAGTYVGASLSNDPNTGALVGEACLDPLTVQAEAQVTINNVQYGGSVGPWDPLGGAWQLWNSGGAAEKGFAEQQCPAGTIESSIAPTFPDLVAGNGSTTDANDIPANQAQFNFCANSGYGTTCGSNMAWDANGNLLFPEEGNNLVQMLAESVSSPFLPGQKLKKGYIYTVAGDGTGDYLGDGGPATQASLNTPSSVAIDPAGNLIISDFGNSVVRLVAGARADPLMPGTALTPGDIYTLAGGSSSPCTDQDGCPATSVAFTSPSGVTVNGSGNLAIVDMGGNQAWLLAATNSDPLLPGMSLTPGDVYLAAGDGSSGYSGDSGPGPQAEMDWPFGATFDSHGNLYVSDVLNGAIRLVAATTSNPLLPATGLVQGDIYTVAGNGTQGYLGDGGPAVDAEIDQGIDSPGDETPKYGGVALDSSGNLYIPDASNQVIRMVGTRSSSPLACGQALTPGDIYTTIGGGGGSAPDGSLSGCDAALYAPAAITFDTTGDLIWVDAGNNVIRMAAPQAGPPYKYTVSGSVYGGDTTNPLQGAYLQVCPNGETDPSDCVEATSGADGSYDVTGVPTGQDVVTVFPPDGTDWSGPLQQTITVNSGNVSGIDFTLQPPQPPPTGTSITDIGTSDQGVPIIYWTNQETLTTMGCAGGTASYQISDETGAVVKTGAMKESPSGSGSYSAAVGSFYPVHGNAYVTITITCGTNTTKITFEIYVDPSGTVVDQNNRAIRGATVTLYQEVGSSFSAVPDGSGVMSPANRSNPGVTDSKGHFGWDVLAGTYQVTASHSGCVNMLNPSSAAAYSPIIAVPPPATGLTIQLSCGKTTVSKLSLAKGKSPVVYGSFLRLVATAGGAKGLIGSVRFWDGSPGRSSSVSLGIVTLRGASARITIGRLAAGTHHLYAVYSGDFTARASIGLFRLIVKPGAVTVVASSASAKEHTAIPPVTASYHGLIKGVSASQLARPALCSTSATVKSKPGKYMNKCHWAKDPNYAFKYKGGVTTITP